MDRQTLTRLGADPYAALDLALCRARAAMEEADRASATVEAAWKDCERAMEDGLWDAARLYHESWRRRVRERDEANRRTVAAFEDHERLVEDHERPLLGGLVSPADAQRQLVRALRRQLDAMLEMQRVSVRVACDGDERPVIRQIADRNFQLTCEAIPILEGRITEAEAGAALVHGL